MDSLTITNEEKNVIILDELIGDCSIPSRDWEAIINSFNSDNRNKLFSIPSIICSRIIQEIKDGAIPKMVFREFGLNFQSFINNYNKIKNTVEELSLLNNLREEDWEFINNCKVNPTFILGKDIDRATAFHFNKSVKHLKGVSEGNPQAWKDYMKVIHAEEFVDKEKDANTEIIIKISPGLIDAI